ncbi:MAG: GTP-binding protein [Clostridiales bacterium]|nr:GTP-binding protein [Clostridiales bacterium]MDD6293940.1 GTP-binding protein [Eubacteriales bacterium]
MTKIDIISGFLGAGKTTLIKKLLEEGLKGEKIVLIENEFGEIGIDGGFLKDAGVQITEMNSGCICCSLVGDFGTALKEVIDKYAPDRIIIEPSGVGKLSDVIKAVTDVMESETADITLNSTTAVVDGLKTKMYMKNFGEFFNNQVESAGTIVISRSQKIPEAKMAECVRLLKEHNPNATIITTPWEDINGSQILAAMEKSGSLAEELLAEEEVCPECGHHHDHDEHHHHDHDEHEHHHHDEDGHEHHHHDHDDECGCGHDHDHDEHEHHHHDGECGCGHDHDGHHHHHHADDVFTSWGTETPRKYTEEEVKTALDKLANTDEYGVILRAKGMLPNVNGEWIYFDLVPGEYELRKGSPDYTGRICVIGTNPDENKLKELFYLAD